MHSKLLLLFLFCFLFFGNASNPFGSQRMREKKIEAFSKSIKTGDYETSSFLKTRFFFSHFKNTNEKAKKLQMNF